MGFKEIYYLKENSEKPIHSAIFNDDVKKAFIDLTSLLKSKNYSVVGGISVGKYNQPRSTVDIDIITINENEIEVIAEELKSKFKHIRKHAFEHKNTGVEVETLTPEFLKVNSSLIKKAIENSIEDNGINVVTPKYLLALKLIRASDSKNIKSLQDQFDIANLIKSYGFFDLNDLDLNKEHLELYNKLNNLYNQKL